VKDRNAEPPAIEKIDVANDVSVKTVPENDVRMSVDSDDVDENEVEVN